MLVEREPVTVLCFAWAVPLALVYTAIRHSEGFVVATTAVKDASDIYMAACQCDGLRWRPHICQGFVALAKRSRKQVRLIFGP